MYGIDAALLTSQRRELEALITLTSSRLYVQLLISRLLTQVHLAPAQLLGRGLSA